MVRSGIRRSKEVGVSVGRSVDRTPPSRLPSWVWLDSVVLSAFFFLRSGEMSIGRSAAT